MNVIEGLELDKRIHVEVAIIYWPLFEIALKSFSCAFHVLFKDLQPDSYMVIIFDVLLCYY